MTYLLQTPKSVQTSGGGRMKSVLIAIRPKYVEKIASGEKTIEIRKTAPKEVPFKCYIYCTYGNMKENYALGKRGKVIGEFVCEWITEINPHCDIDGCVNQYIHSYPAILGDDCLSFNEMKAYLGNKKGYDWHISNLKIYDNPRELSEFSRPCSYSGLCFSCKRTSFKKDGNLLCNTKITRPPQSWMYVKI